MGRIKKKVQIPLSVFYLKYFAYIFICVLLLAIGLLFLFNALMNDNIVYPANYAQEQAENAYSRIQEAKQISEDLIPESCDYAVFDLDGNREGGNLTGNSAQEAWDAIQQASTKIGKYNYTVIPRNTEYCVLRYTLSPQYKSSLLQKILIPSEILVFVLAIWGMFLIITIIAIRFGRVLNRKLSTLILLANKVEQQELDFEILSCGIKEVDAIPHSMDNMRTELKGALEQQWKIEQLQREQIAALSHDFKTPLTVIQGNIDLISETKLDDEQQLYAKYITESSEQMQLYIRTLIDISQTVTGYQLHLEDIDLIEYMKRIESQANLLCITNGICLHIEIGTSEGYFKADKLLLERAIMNVIHNALDYSTQGGNLYVTAQKADGFLKNRTAKGRKRLRMDRTAR